MKFLPLLFTTIFATPLIRSYNVKATMNGSGSGSIEVTVGDDDWTYEWPELTDDVREYINNQLSDMGLDGGLDENNNFKFGVSASSKTENLPLTETTGSVNLGASVSGQEPLVVTDTFTGNSVEELEAWMKESQAKFLAMIKEQSESFYNAVKAQLDQINAQ